MRTHEYLEARYVPEPNSGCWLWTGMIYKRYGIASWQEGQRQIRTTAHRVAYEVWVGPIDAGLTVDHLCRNTACINPAHLEAVTEAENISRSDCASAVNRRKDRCNSGHVFDDSYIRKDVQRIRRRCKECVRAAGRRYRARLNAAAA